MNYGYALLNSEGKTIRNLDPELEEERFCLQLTHNKLMLDIFINIIFSYIFNFKHISYTMTKLR